MPKNLLKIIILVYFSSIIYAQKFAEILFYTGGKKIITLQPIPENIGYKLRLRGTSKYKNLYFQINKLDEFNRIKKQREVRLDLKNSNEFDYYYYLKDGTGRYEIVIFGNNSGAGRYSGLCNFYINSRTNIPQNLAKLNINNKIIEFVNSVMGKKVGRGECWDLAQAVLDYYSADWKRPTYFGIPLNPEKDNIIPGDIIQMYNVRLEYNNKIEYFGLPEHTAIVYKVISKNNFKIAHQNVAGKRFVILSNFNLKYVKTGNVKFYRPVAGLIKAR